MNVFKVPQGLSEPSLAPSRRLQRRSFRPGVEPLEERQLLSTWVVTTALDNGDDNNPTQGSLREAILLADTFGAAGDKIVFNIPGAGVHTIVPPTGLPAASKPLTIDGYTQPGAAVNTAANFDNAQLKIVLDGGLLHNNENGLLLTAGGTTVRGLVIDNFPGEGIYLNNAGGDTVAGNFIGTDVSGKVAAGNAGGVFASNAGLNKIGGAALGDRNVISGNNGGGIFLFSDGNSVQNNFVGADASAMADLHNAFGIEVHGSNNLIGGGSPSEGNLIAG